MKQEMAVVLVPAGGGFAGRINSQTLANMTPEHLRALATLQVGDEFTFIHEPTRVVKKRRVVLTESFATIEIHFALAH